MIKKLTLERIRDSLKIEVNKIVIDGIIQDLIELEVRRNKDVPVVFGYGSPSQTRFLYGTCPKCRNNIKYNKDRRYIYCSTCGQLVHFDVFSESFEGKIQKFEFKYLVGSLKDIYIKVIEASTLKEAVLIFYDELPNNFKILEVSIDNNNDDNIIEEV